MNFLRGALGIKGKSPFTSGNPNEGAVPISKDDTHIFIKKILYDLMTDRSNDTTRTEVDKIYVTTESSAEKVFLTKENYGTHGYSIYFKSLDKKIPLEEVTFWIPADKVNQYMGEIEATRNRIMAQQSIDINDYKLLTPEQQTSFEKRENEHLFTEYIKKPDQTGGYRRRSRKVRTSRKMRKTGKSKKSKKSRKTKKTSRKH
jgi:hypothetical protein